MSTKVNPHISAKSRATDRIKSAKIITKLLAVIDGSLEMTAVQLNACRLLLNKTLPDLKAIEQTIVDERVQSKLDIDTALKAQGINPDDVWKSLH